MTGCRSILLSLVALSASCTAQRDNKLMGSIAELYPLDFTQVRIRGQLTDLIVDYLKEKAGAVEKPCRLVVETAELEIRPNVAIADPEFSASVHVSRVMVGGEPFPDIQRGELTLKTYEFKNGGRIDGEFFVEFVNGRGLNGVFGGEMQKVVGE
jgi:hypothetical protein